MKKVVAVVLGGGRGSRLIPLTRYRSKPAVPLAGKYRLIDIPLSNCLNSGIYHVYVLTQFLSVSLHRHIRRTYRFDHLRGGFVEILAAQQTMQDDTGWYQGTADAVRKNLRYVEQPGIEHVLILSGDQLYRMDFAEMIAGHERSGADVTIAAKPYPASAVSDLGVMRVDESGRVIGFVEKPGTDELVQSMRMDPAWIEAQGIACAGREWLASMGIYLFRRDVLVEMLRNSPDEDFGKQVFPSAIGTRHVHVHLFDGYWEDIGTIGAFYRANLELTRQDPPFDLASAVAPIYSRPRFLPPTRIDAATVRESLIADGCVIQEGAVIENSVIGLRCRIGAGVTIRDAVLMGADQYETPAEIAAGSAQGWPRIGVGDGSRIEGAIVDKNCRIGRDVRIHNESGIANRDVNDSCTVRDGVVVIQKNAVLGDGVCLPG